MYLRGREGCYRRSHQLPFTCLNNWFALESGKTILLKILNKNSNFLLVYHRHILMTSFFPPNYSCERAKQFPGLAAHRSPSVGLTWHTNNFLEFKKTSHFLLFICLKDFGLSCGQWWHQCPADLLLPKSLPTSVSTDPVKLRRKILCLKGT